MFTYDEALDRWIQDLPWGLKALYENDRYRNPRSIYCCHCGWFYPHDNWTSSYCPMCNKEVQYTNANYQLGFFGT